MGEVELGGKDDPFVELRDSLKETGEDTGGAEVCFGVDRVSYTHTHTHTHTGKREGARGEERKSKRERERWRDRVGERIPLLTFRAFIWPTFQHI